MQHRDTLLTDPERDCGMMLTCVSRAGAGQNLRLDLWPLVVLVPRCGDLTRDVDDLGLLRVRAVDLSSHMGPATALGADLPSTLPMILTISPRSEFDVTCTAISEGRGRAMSIGDHQWVGSPGGGPQCDFTVDHETGLVQPGDGGQFDDQWYPHGEG